MSLFAPFRPRRILHDGDAFVVVDKPAGVPCDPRGEAVDLGARVSRQLGRELSVLAPLDAAASGVVLLGDPRHGAPRVTSTRWVVGTTGPARGLRTVAEAKGRRLVALERRAPRPPAGPELAEAGALPAGDRGGAPYHRTLLHRASLTVEGRDFVASPPPCFESWLRGDPFPRGDDLRARLEDAIDRRYPLACLPDTNAFRVVNGAGDGIDGVDVDRYGDHAVVALRSDEAFAHRDAICDAVAALGFAGIYLKLRPRQANVIVDTRRDDVAPREPVRGRAAPDRFVIHEARVPYEVRLGDGLSTGIFLDQRDARRWLRDDAAGKRVLNLFCYHAAFTVAAIAGGAASTVSVDSARPALERARDNLDRAGADPTTHRLFRRDAREFLEGALRRGERYDRVVLDPPSYATTRARGKSRVFRAERDYRPIAARCLRLLAPGGKLLACTNHRGIDPDRFARLLRSAARDAEVDVVSLTPLPDPADHPPAPGEPCHLKRLVLEVAP